MKPSTYERLGNIADHLVEHNSEVGNTLRASVAIQELALSLSESMLKTNSQDVIDNIARAIVTLQILVRLHDKEKIEESIVNHLNSINNRMNERDSNES